MWDKSGEFLISEHKSLLDDLNKISDDLLKAKWHFIVAISAIALAYKFIIEDFKRLTNFGTFPLIGDYNFSSALTSLHIDGNEVYFAFAICVVGNIILWLLSEYILSHGFLFRYIQGRAAVIEKIFNSGDNNLKVFKDKYQNLIHDSFVKEEYIGLNNKLDPDLVIPDQFGPLYWASIWLMVLNSIFGFFVVHHFFELDQSTLSANWEFSFPIFILTSAFFVKKLLHYYLWKTRKLFEKSGFIIYTNEGDDYLKYPKWVDCCIGVICLCIYICCARHYGFKHDIFYYCLILWFFIGFYLTTFGALLLHIIVYFFNCDPPCLKPTLGKVGEHKCTRGSIEDGFKVRKQVSVYCVNDSSNILRRLIHLIRLII